MYKIYKFILFSPSSQDKSRNRKSTQSPFLNGMFLLLSAVNKYKFWLYAPFKTVVYQVCSVNVHVLVFFYIHIKYFWIKKFYILSFCSCLHSLNNWINFQNKYVKFHLLIWIRDTKKRIINTQCFLISEL